VIAGALAVSALAVFASLNSYQVSSQYARQYPDAYGVNAAERRFAALMPRLPASGPVGYVTDLPLSETAGTTAFLATQYVMAPRLLIPLTGRVVPDWVLGNFSQRADFRIAGARYGLVMLGDFGSGVILYHRAQPGQAVAPPSGPSSVAPPAAPAVTPSTSPARGAKP
jgi:hypothetical protein